MYAKNVINSDEENVEIYFFYYLYICTITLYLNAAVLRRLVDYRLSLTPFPQNKSRYPIFRRIMLSDYEFNYTDKNPKLLMIEYRISLEIGLVFSAVESSVCSQMEIYKVI